MRGDWYAKAMKNKYSGGLRRMKRMNGDAWLASMGLERRNVKADIAGAIGFTLFGCALGIGIGLLFAPRHGAQTREKIAEKMRHLKRGAEETAHEAREAINDSAWQS